MSKRVPIYNNNTVPRTTWKAGAGDERIHGQASLARIISITQHESSSIGGRHCGVARFTRSEGDVVIDWCNYYDEAFYIIRGKGRFKFSTPPYTSEDTCDVGPGDYLYLPVNGVRISCEALTDEPWEWFYCAGVGAGDVNIDYQGCTSVREEIEAPATSVWEAVQNFGDASAWFPEAKVLDIEGQGTGATRRIQIPTGEIYTEKCVVHEPASFKLSYVIMEGPMPCSNYLADVQVETVDERRSVITWSCTFDAPAEEVKEIENLFENTYQSIFIASLRNHFAKG